MKKGFSINKNIYVILAAIVVLAIIMQVSRSEYVLQFSRNTNLAESRQIFNSNLGQAEATDLGGPTSCVLYDSEEEVSVSVKNNATRLLQYMKRKTLSIDTSVDSINLDSCAMTIITNQILDEIGNIDSLSDYVNDGGYVMFTNTLEMDHTFNKIYRQLGIISSSEPFLAQGIELKSNVLIGEKDLIIDDPYVANSMNRIEIDDSSELLATSVDGMPLMWRRDHGQGAFMVFNGTMLVEKINRGLIAGGISLLEPDFIYPIFNSKQIYIDDFPAPIQKGINDSIYQQYHKDVSHFYRDIWWPDMLKAAKNADLKYTAVLIQSYTDRVDPPFNSPVDEDRYNLLSYGREVIKSGGEIGIHGYNHQSLQMDEEIADNYGYKVWPSTSVMSQSISESLKYANISFPNYKIMSYVPPSNMISSEGREALKEAWPDLTVISSLYEEDITNMSYIQEYEVAEDGIIEMPRVTSGYVDNPIEHWAEANTITSLGIYSHFVHPDDVLDELRGKQLSWAELYKAYSTKLERLKKTYPWLRAMTATEGAIDLEKVLNSRVEWTKEVDSIRGDITNFQDDNYFVLRTARSIAQLKHCSVSKIDENTYLVKATEAKFQIGLGG
ncbi:DUF2194 domain-containing protein [Paenibacillus sp. FA6]|uniref:DUF2194 domain-containing protein n=1 Tax=Paenibacillus sp. FA6 TaxID=3413029 RepID=UPI003F657D64